MDEWIALALLAALLYVGVMWAVIAAAVAAGVRRSAMEATDLVVERLRHKGVITDQRDHERV